MARNILEAVATTLQRSPSIVEAAEFVPGWMTKSELQWLHQTAVSLPMCGATWVELGTWAGRSALCVGLSLPTDATLVLVDYKMFTAEPHKAPALDDKWKTFDFNLPDVLHTLAIVRPTLKILTLKTFTHEIPKLIQHANVVFIDADHRYEAVMREYKEWQGRMQAPAILAGHDYHEAWPGVVQAVNEIAMQEGNSLLRHGNSIWQIHRLT